ncbi:ATP-binding protein [Brachyspira aalborgi]|uniref:ATP-binding protein n=1 Tax=Brachyspira aalborgi TaxID=29522 RepID=A0A5C8EF90_9SPIR|nr:AAA family ATPase [Brachyspira aalborgi]TXJ36445.1 ATP-binding protein [Brachyspira aalborgi]TXJ52051.1 ATP-binding protein [Brachyspira aalborgi]
MKIERIEIKNFKRFTHLVIEELNKNLKLILVVGSNGCGKSSLFEAFNYWHLKSTFNLNSEKDYYNKFKDNVDCNIKFYGENKPINESIFYFRTAYRNQAEFKLTTFNEIKNINTKINKKMINNESEVSNNYNILIGNTINELFFEKNNDKKVSELRNDLIGKIQQSMHNVFEDLMLNNLGNPFKEGTFYFKKGIIDKFNYKNLSAGEKSAFDLILDLVLKIDYYNDGIFFIDEPEIHMHTSLQSKLIKELYNIIPDNSQLWITTHSIGIMRMAERILKENPNSVAMLDFDSHDFDNYVIIKPTKLSKTVWEKFLSLALDDLSELIIPEYIVLSEGSFSGNKRYNYDATIYNKIFNDKYPNILFISGGSSEDIIKEDYIPEKIIKNFSKSINVKKLLDRDDMTDEEVKVNEEKNIIVLSKRHIESYLLDDEIIKKFIDNNKPEKYTEIQSLIKNVIINSIDKGNPKDDIKRVRGEIYNILRKELSLTQCGNTADAFIINNLVPLITPDTEIYKVLEVDIIKKIIP